MTCRIRLGAGVADLEPKIERIGTYSFAAQIAPRFRQGRTFLVGDAAHRVTPRGGTGMNTALHDGYDLGWVLRGWAAPELLDTHEPERRPIVEHYLARSADPDGAHRSVEDELHFELGGRIPHVRVPSTGQRRSTLDLLGPSLTLLTGPAGTAWSAAAATVTGRLPLDVHRLDLLTARAMGMRADGALLVRPDGWPAGCWPDEADAVNRLHGAINAACCRAPRSAEALGERDVA